MNKFELHQGDCLEVMPTLSADSVAMVFADLPYQATRQVWDIAIDLAQLWPMVNRCAIKAAAVVMTGTQPFTSQLVMSNLGQFRYDLQWLKTNATGFLNAKRMPLRAHETLLLFYRSLPVYNAQMTKAVKLQGKASRAKNGVCKNWNKHSGGQAWQETGKRYPVSYLRVPSINKQQSLHPTQKPLVLLEWLIATYTNPGDTVLDPVMGSGTTGVACANLGRRFVGIEKDATYFAAAKARIESAYADARAKLAI